MNKSKLDEALEAFKSANDAWEENRRRYIEDIKFARFGEQWPDYAINMRGQSRPTMTFNRMPAFIRQVVNDARQNKPSIKVYPVDSGADVKTAEVLSGLIRSIEANSNADIAYDTAIDNSVSGGFGFFRINIDYAHDDTFDRDIVIERIQNPLIVYPDELSTAADSSDWNKCFISELMPKEDFRREYPGAEEVDWKLMSQDDIRGEWVSEEMIRIAEWWQRTEVEKTILLMSDGKVIDSDVYEKDREYWQQDGVYAKQERAIRTHKVTRKLMTGAEIISDTEWEGKYIPIIALYGEEIVDEHGKRHFFGLTHAAQDEQRAWNYWRTSAIEKVALETKAPWIGPKGAFNSDWDKWATSNTTAHAFLEYDGPIAPQRTPFGGVPSGDMAMAAMASDGMKSILGIYDASLGAKSNETSGRAIIARDRQGETSSFHFVDNMSRAIRHAGRVILDLTPHAYPAPRVVRTLAENGEIGLVQINQEHLVDGIAQIYDFTTGKYDVIVKAGPSYTTKRQEAADQMVAMIQSYPPLAEIAGDLLVKNLDWPGADELAERIKSTIPSAQEENPQMQQMQAQMQEAFAQMQQQLQQAGQIAQKLQAENQALKADRQLEMSRVALEGQKFELEKLRALRELQTIENGATEGEVSPELAIEQWKAQLDSETKIRIAEIAAEDHRQACEMSFKEKRLELGMDAGAGLYDIDAVQADVDALRKMIETPQRKVARAVKQADGSWIMESEIVQTTDRG